MKQQPVATPATLQEQCSLTWGWIFKSSPLDMTLSTLHHFKYHWDEVGGMSLSVIYLKTWFWQRKFSSMVVTETLEKRSRGNVALKILFHNPVHLEGGRYPFVWRRQGSHGLRSLCELLSLLAKGINIQKDFYSCKNLDSSFNVITSLPSGCP